MCGLLHRTSGEYECRSMGSEPLLASEFTDSTSTVVNDEDDENANPPPSSSDTLTLSRDNQFEDPIQNPHEGRKTNSPRRSPNRQSMKVRSRSRRDSATASDSPSGNEPSLISSICDFLRELSGRSPSHRYEPLRRNSDASEEGTILDELDRVGKRRIDT